MTILEVRLTAGLAASADRVWGVVGNFNGLPDWHPWVRKSVLEPAPGGVGRRVAIVGGTGEPRELVERLISYDASARRYAYAIVAGPAPFKNYVGNFCISPEGPDRCVFDYASRFEAADGATDRDALARVRTFYEAARDNLVRMFGK